MSGGDPRARSEAMVLFLRLEAPLMAWGDSARWTVRETRREPTKSGVIGLLATCLGWAADRGDDERIAALAATVRLGVRADRPGTIVRDYHTVVGGVLSADGRVKKTASTGEWETVVSERFYLSDACFLAVLVGPTDLIDMLEGAVADPVWPPFLGRKSCPPSAPIFPALPGHVSRAEHPPLEEALAAFPYLGRDKPPATARAVIETPGGTGAPGVPLQRRHDQPLSFGARLFGYRYVYEINLPIAASGLGETGGDDPGRDEHVPV